jgi:hypothetical protein
MLCGWILAPGNISVEPDCPVFGAFMHSKGVALVTPSAVDAVGFGKHQLLRKWNG